jgi:hypothetical protein
MDKLKVYVSHRDDLGVVLFLMTPYETVYVMYSGHAKSGILTVGDYDLKSFTSVWRHKALEVYRGWE